MCTWVQPVASCRRRLANLLESKYVPLSWCRCITYVTQLTRLVTPPSLLVAFSRPALIKKVSAWQELSSAIAARPDADHQVFETHDLPPEVFVDGQWTPSSCTAVHVLVRMLCCCRP